MFFSTSRSAELTGPRAQGCATERGLSRAAGATCDAAGDAADATCDETGGAAGATCDETGGGGPCCDAEACVDSETSADAEARGAGVSEGESTVMLHNVPVLPAATTPLPQRHGHAAHCALVLVLVLVLRNAHALHLL
ncbi:hypothetical protein GCM10027416_01540 [Okibacterium endophyticum]